MKITTLVLLSLLLTSNSFADEVFGSYGLGIFKSALNSRTEVKVASFGYRAELYDGYYWQYKGGYWSEQSGDPTRKSSAYFSTGPGVTIDLSPIEFRGSWGICAITQTDSYLGGNFPQFNGEIYAGVRDKRQNGIGVKYEHVSSAGVFTPNQGRDLVTVEFSQRW